MWRIHATQRTPCVAMLRRWFFVAILKPDRKSSWNCPRWSSVIHWNLGLSTPRITWMSQRSYQVPPQGFIRPATCGKQWALTFTGRSKEHLLVINLEGPGCRGRELSRAMQQWTQQQMAAMPAWNESVSGQCLQAFMKRIKICLKIGNS